MITYATCTTILAALSAATGGDTIVLSGECGAFTISQTYSSTVFIDATDAVVSGLKITGGNIEWRGGTLKASGGLNGATYSGYALYMTATNVKVADVLFTDARIGALVKNSAQITFSHDHFDGVRTDGIQISQTDGLVVEDSTFEHSQPVLSTCTMPDGTVYYQKPLSQCTGTYVDGDHPDALQMRDNVRNALVIRNTVRGATQGLGQMDSTNDAPLANIRLAYNDVVIERTNPMTLGNCAGCSADHNFVWRTPDNPYPARIRIGTLPRCGNQVPDDATQDAPCTFE